MVSVSLEIKLFGAKFGDINAVTTTPCCCCYVQFPSDKVSAKHMKQLETSKYSGKGFYQNLLGKVTCNLTQSAPDYPPAWRRRDKDVRARQERI